MSSQLAATTAVNSINNIDKQSKSENPKDKYTLLLRLLNLANDSKSIKYLSVFFACSISFAIIDLTKSKVNALLFKAVFTRDKTQFVKRLKQLIIYTFVLSCFNKTLANFVSRFSSRVTELLTWKFHNIYFRNLNYYKLQNIDSFSHGVCGSDNVTGTETTEALDDLAKIEVDENYSDVFVSDIPLLSRDFALASCDVINASVNFLCSFVAVYSFTKRLDFEFFTQSGKDVHTRIPMTVGPSIYAFLISTIISQITPKHLGRIVKEKRETESAFKSAHNRFFINAESIAFLKGQSFEKQNLIILFDKVMKKASDTLLSSFGFDVVKEFLVRYCTHALMYACVLIPFFRFNTSSPQSIPSRLYQVRYLADILVINLISLGQLGRLSITFKHMRGILARVLSLWRSLNAVDKIDLSTKTDTNPQIISTSEDFIEFRDVDIITPNNHMLVKGLSFKVVKGQHLLICGPNGAGKSSIFRVLGGLWKVSRGAISKSYVTDEKVLSGDIFYLPQKPYCVYGSLRQNIVYPDVSVHVPDSKINQLLEMVELFHLRKRSSYDDVKNWDDVLSLGEKQRLAMARLFFHRPKFAILDECTSAVSIKMEKRLFVTCHKLGVTLITISHRPALHEFHHRMLVLNGAGGYAIETIPHNEVKEETSTLNIEEDLSIDEVYGDLKRSGSVSTNLDLNQSNDPLPSTVRPSKDLRSKFTILANSAKLMSRRDYLSISSIFGLICVSTAITNSIAHSNGRSIQYLIEGNFKKFIQLTGFAIFSGFLQASITPSIDAISNSLSLEWRRRLTESATQIYLNRFYEEIVINEESHTDQIITSEITEFSNLSSNLFVDIFKPIVDLTWFGSSMMILIGPINTLLSLSTYAIFVTFILKLMRPNFSKLLKNRDALDVEYSHVHERLTNVAESVAFLNGCEIEKNVLNKALASKMKAHRDLKLAEHLFGTLEQFLTHFVPTQIGWILTMLYSINKSQSISNIGELSHLIRYLGSVISHSFSSMGNVVETVNKVNKCFDHGQEILNLFSHEVAVNHEKQTNGKINRINLNVYTPNAKNLLVSKLSLNLTISTLITGPNGVGKTSVFRCICGLWSSNLMTLPMTYYVPTRPYLPSHANFMSLVSYLSAILNIPNLYKSIILEVNHNFSTGENRVEILKKNYVDRFFNNDINEFTMALACLFSVRLGYLVERMMSSINDKSFNSWEHIFSLGEQQRICIARCLYNLICFRKINKSINLSVILDECTSAVALDGEAEIYNLITNVVDKIVIFTASQKPWLVDFHESIVYLSGDGAWTTDEVRDRETMEIKRNYSKNRLPDIVYTDHRQ